MLASLNLRSPSQLSRSGLHSIGLVSGVEFWLTSAEQAAQKTLAIIRNSTSKGKRLLYSDRLFVRLGRLNIVNCPFRLCAELMSLAALSDLARRLLNFWFSPSLSVVLIRCCKNCLRKFLKGEQRCLETPGASSAIGCSERLSSMTTDA